MPEKEVPTYRCTYCLHALPEEYDQELFGSTFFRPKSDEAETFVADTQTILRYAAAVALASTGALQMSDELVTRLHDLVGELIDEALRRLERADDAFHIHLMRRAEAEQAHPAQPDGRATA